MKNSIVNARMESELKTEVEAIFKQLGMNTTQAISMFFEQVRLYRAIPFQIKLPNKDTVEVMEEITLDELISRGKSRVMKRYP